MPEQKHRVQMNVLYRDGSNYKVWCIVNFKEGEHLDPSDVQALLAAREGDRLDLGFAHELKHPGQMAAETDPDWAGFPTDDDGDFFEVTEKSIYCLCQLVEGHDFDTVAKYGQSVGITFNAFVQNYLHRKGSGRRHDDCLLMKRVRGWL